MSEQETIDAHLSRRRDGGGALDPNRCAVCGWPLKDRPADGCVRGNCSQRPRPHRLYDPERATAERNEAENKP